MAANQLYKLNMEDGSNLIIRSEVSMFEIGNDLRTKAKVAFKTEYGSNKSVKSADVRSIEHYIPQRRA